MVYVTTLLLLLIVLLMTSEAIYLRNRVQRHVPASCDFEDFHSDRPHEFLHRAKPFRPDHDPLRNVVPADEHHPAAGRPSRLPRCRRPGRSPATDRSAAVDAIVQIRDFSLYYGGAAGGRPSP